MKNYEIVGYEISNTRKTRQTTADITAKHPFWSKQKPLSEMLRKAVYSFLSKQYAAMEREDIYSCSETIISLAVKLQGL